MATCSPALPPASSSRPTAISRSKKTRWRQGALFEAEGCKILVEADIAASPKRIDIQVCGPNEHRRAALAVILNELGHVHALNPECAAKPRVPLPDQPEHDVSYDHLLKLEGKYGPTHEFDPEGADRPYTVAELLNGVRHEQRLERHPKEGAARQYIAENMVVNEVSGRTEGDVAQTGAAKNAAPPTTTRTDTPAMGRWVPAIGATAAALVMALVLSQFEGLKPTHIMIGSAMTFAIVYGIVAYLNPDYMYRRLIAFVIGVLVVGNVGGPILEAPFVSEALSASIQWDGTTPQSFNIVGLLILALLAVLEWQRMQQAGKMSPA